MPRFCPSCGAHMALTAFACPGCGTASLPSVSGGSGGGTPQPAGGGGGGLTDNVVGLLVYLFGILAVVFLLIEPYNKNKTVRFHCFQSLFFIGAIIAAWIALVVLGFVLGMIPVVGAILIFLCSIVVWLGSVVVWILLMVKAYQGQMWKLPFIGDLAEKQANS